MPPSAFPCAWIRVRERAESREFALEKPMTVAPMTMRSDRTISETMSAIPVLSSDASPEFHDPPHARVVFRRTMSAAKRQLAIESAGVTSTGRTTLSFPSAAVEGAA